MSSPADRNYEPDDPSPYAPRWVRNAPPPPRAPVRSSLLPDRGEANDERMLRQDDEAGSDHAPPLTADDEDSFAVGDFRVPRSLDPGIVPDPWAERGVRLRRYRALGMLGRVALAGSAAAIVALLAVGKLSLPGSSGATEQADTSPAVASHVPAPATKPQEPPIVAQEPSDLPQQVALADAATPVSAARPSVAAAPPAPVPPPPASAATAPQMPAAEPSASAPAPELSPDELAALLSRGQQLAASGDIAAARLTLRPAAEARNGQAALALGATYDPVVLRSLGIMGVTPDVAMARSWYQKAKEYGSAEAPRRLELLAKSQ
jgi:TPR repeat protein